MRAELLNDHLSARDLDLDAGGLKTSRSGLLFDRFDHRLRHGEFHDRAGALLDHDFTASLGAVGDSAWEIAVHNADVMNKSDLLKSREDSVDANHVNFSARRHDLVVDGVGTQGGFGVGQGSDHLDAGHGNSVSRVAEFTQSIFFVALGALTGRWTGDNIPSLIDSLSHVTIIDYNSKSQLNTGC